MRYRLNANLLVLMLCACGAGIAHAASENKKGAGSQVKPIALPGSGPANLDYLAFDPKSHTLWIPTANTGQVAVLDTVSLKMTAVPGFATATKEELTLGPSSAAIGEDMVFVGNRADSKVCVVETKTLRIGSCVTLDSMPDGLAYVPNTREVWVTTPRDRSLTLIGVSPKGELTVKASLPLPGTPEGYAVDAEHGLFYTNLKDKDRTLAIDVKSRKVKTSVSPTCGKEGPRGLALDPRRRLLFVACTDGAVSFKNGQRVGRIKTGNGVDNIDYANRESLLFIPSGQTGVLTVAQVDARGAMSKLADVTTGDGCRGVTTDSEGNAFVIDPKGGRLLMVKTVR